MTSPSVAEARLRAEVVRVGRSLHERALTPGSTGNISVRIAGGFLVTPTGSSLGRLSEAALSRLGPAGELLAGPAPTKEVPLHLAVYRARPQLRAVVHLHSPYATALSVVAGLNEADVLPPLTAYYAMRVGRLPLVPFVVPGDARLGDLTEPSLTDTDCVLLANHGPVAGGSDLGHAADAAEEIEATARLWFLLGDRSIRPLTPEQALAARTPSKEKVSR